MIGPTIYGQQNLPVLSNQRLHSWVHSRSHNWLRTDSLGHKVNHELYPA